MKYYFVSDKNLDGETLYPRVPTNRMKIEDCWTPRICVSQSINGCLSAIGAVATNKIYYVHECESESVKQPLPKYVPDVCFTGEIWITKPVEMKLFMVIMTTGCIDTEVNNMSNPVYSFKLMEDMM